MNSHFASTSFREELPFTSRAPSIAREQLRRFAHGLPSATVDDAVLMVSELVTNALVHGKPEITLSLRQMTDRLTVAVGDLGEAVVACAMPGPDQTSGRGLVIVDALSTRWGVSRSEDRVGKRVWFDIGS